MEGRKDQVRLGATRRVLPALVVLAEAAYEQTTRLSSGLATNRIACKYLSRVNLFEEQLGHVGY